MQQYVSAVNALQTIGLQLEFILFYLSHAGAAKARSELPPSFPIHSQIPGLPEAHAIQVSPELLGPAGP